MDSNSDPLSITVPETTNASAAPTPAKVSEPALIDPTSESTRREGNPSGPRLET